STGGMFLPPVMGAVSFLIADFLAVPYVQVLTAAVIPAILYFIAVFVQADLRASQIEANIDEKDREPFEAPEIKQVLIDKGHLLIPLLTLIYLLIFYGASAIHSAFFAIVSIPVVSFFRKETRMSLGNIVDALQRGVKLSLIVVSACACAGIVIGVID